MLVGLSAVDHRLLDVVTDNHSVANLPVKVTQWKFMLMAHCDVIYIGYFYY